jgi:hypothetical protein
MSGYVLDNLKQELSRPIEVELFIDGPDHRCITLKYTGPVSDFPERVLAEASRCFPNLQASGGTSKNTKKTKPHKPAQKGKENRKHL